MKQFLTLCLATAMLGTSLNVDAKITLQEAMKLKSEGKALKAPMKVRDTKSLKSLPKVSASRFHKMMDKKAEKNMMLNAPGKVTAKGDNIYGFLGYSNDNDAPYGLYEIENPGASLVWEDEVGLSVSGLGLQDGVLKGYGMFSFFGYVLGNYYLEYDFESGEVLAMEEQDLSTNPNFIQGLALDPEEGVMYGYGYYGDDYAFMSASVDSPFDYSLIKVVDMGCMSLCYNPEDQGIYGVNWNYEFVKINTATGETTTIMDLKEAVPNGATYLTGLVYDPISKIYYWNINYDDDYSAALATIDVANQKVEIVEDLANGEEYISFVTPDEVPNPLKPQRPTAGASDFYKNNLIGFVTFTMPTLMGDDAPIEGELEYKAYLDGQLYSTGNSNPGAEVRLNFAVSDAGMHTFALSAVKDGVESAKASLKAYIGNDTPLAPAYVEIKEGENDNYTISWAAVGSEGVHGGYVDAKAILYNVSLNGVALQTTSETQVSVTLPSDAELSAYTASVSAECNGFVSSEASSAAILVGEAFELPVAFQPTADEFAISTVLDGNEDGSTWQYGLGSDGQPVIYSNWNSYNTMDDWYFLPPVKLDDPSKFYSFSMEVALNSISFPNEYVEVLLCNEPSANGVVGIIMDEFSPEGSSFERAAAEFRVRQPGEYYIAIHCTSEADQYGLYARNFKVEDNNITLDSPAAVDDIELEAAEKGELKATATFYMPTATFGGRELAADADLVATVSCGENKATVSGKPGEEVSATVETAQGDNNIYVTVSLGDNNSPVAYATVYTGYSVPQTPAAVNATMSADNCTAVLSWDAVTDPDVEGGYLDPETVVYDIYLYDNESGSWSLYDEGITETTYSYTDDSIQSLARIGVVARNEAGDNGYLAVAGVVIGPAYSLPIIENIMENQALVFDPWVTYTVPDREAPQAKLYNVTDLLGSGYGEGFVMGFYGGADAMGYMGTPVFSTKGLNQVVLELGVYAGVELPKVTIYAQTYGTERTAIGTVEVNAKDAFERVSIALPAEFLDKEAVDLFIEYEFETGSEMLIIDYIAISDGASVASLAGQGVKIAGGKNVINVSGLNGQNVTVADLNGRVVAKSAKVASSASFQVEKGIYVVEAADKKVKVVVK